MKRIIAFFMQLFSKTQEVPKTTFRPMTEDERGRAGLIGHYDPYPTQMFAQDEDGEFCRDENGMIVFEDPTKGERYRALNAVEYTEKEFVKAFKKRQRK